MYVNDFNDHWTVKKSIFRANPAHVYHRRILINGMSVTVMATWFPLPLCNRQMDLAAHQNWSNIMVSLPSKSRGNRHVITSSGDAMKAIEDIGGKNLKVSIFRDRFVFEERLSGSPRLPAPYALSPLIVFLCLAALYESWHSFLGHAGCSAWCPGGCLCYFVARPW